MAFGDFRGTGFSIFNSSTSSNSIAVTVGGIAVQIGDLILVTIGHQQVSSGETFPGPSADNGAANTYTNLEASNTTTRQLSVWGTISTNAFSLTSVTVSGAGSSGNDIVVLVSVFQGPFFTSSVSTSLRASNHATTDILSPFVTPTITTQDGDLILGFGVADQSTVWAASNATLIANTNSGAIIKVAGARRISSGGFLTGSVSFTAGSNPTICHLATLSFKPAVTGSVSVAPGSGNISLSSTAPTLSFSNNRNIELPAGNLSLSTASPTLRYDFGPVIAAAQLLLTADTAQAIVQAPGQKTPSQANLTLTTTAPTSLVSINTTVAPTAGQLALSTQVPELAIHYPTNHLSMAGTATVTLTLPFVLFAATREFITEPDDQQENQPFYGTLQKALRLDRTILNGGGIGQVTLGWGELQLINADANYDDFIDQYTVDGRRVLLKIGVAGPPFVFDNFVTVFDGSATDWHIDEDVMRIEVRDNSFKLEVPAQPRIYDGTGGLEGGDDLAGKRVPRAWGRVKNATPAPLIPPELVYQINDGEVVAFDAVYDGGVPLIAAVPADYANSTLLRAAATGAQGSGQPIEAGEYATCKVEGLVRLGGTPQGRVTCDVMGLRFRGSWIRTHADIIFSLVAPSSSGAPGTVPVPVDDISFDQVNDEQPAEIGYYLDEGSELTVADVIAELANSMGGWAGFRGRAGTFEVGIFTDPDEDVPTARYERLDIMDGTLTREKLPADFSPPPYRFRVAYDRNWTVQTDLFGAVDAARVAYLKEAFRLATSDTADAIMIQTNHPLAQDPPAIEAFFSDEVDAEAEADRRLALYGLEQRSLYRFTVKSRPFVHDIGDVVNLTYPRWDLTSGLNLRIVSITESTDDNTTELVGFG